HVSVGGAGAGRVDVQAYACLALIAHLATTTGDVEGNRADVALLDEQHVAAGLDHFAAGLDHFAGDLVPQSLPHRRGGAGAHHVLVASANIGGHDLEHDGVGCRLGDAEPVGYLVGDLELRVVDVLHRCLAGPLEPDDTIVSHDDSSFD